MEEGWWGDPAEAVAVDAEAVPMHWLDPTQKHCSTVGTGVITIKNENQGRGLSPRALRHSTQVEVIVPETALPRGQTMNCDLTT